MKFNWKLVLVALIGAAFAAFMLWSVLYETLLPLIQAQDWAGLTRNLVGIPLVFGGTGLFVWSAWLLLRGLLGGEGGWRRVLIVFMLSVLMLAVGGRLTN